MKIKIGSYHKTGGGLFRRIFNHYSQIDKDFKFDFYWNFSEANIDLKNIAIIRHPFEVIMSAVRYHQISTEPWLLEKDKNGFCYKDKITSFSTMEQKINFEIENCSKKVINSMISDVFNKKAIFIKLENFFSRTIRAKTSKLISNYLEIKNNILHEVIEDQIKIKSNSTNNFSNFTWLSNFTKDNYRIFDKHIGIEKIAQIGYNIKIY